MRCSVSDEKLELDHYKINIDYLFRLQLADNLVDIGSGSAGRYKSLIQMYNVFIQLFCSDFGVYLETG